jgi:hypothetical protein
MALASNFKRLSGLINQSQTLPMGRLMAALFSFLITEAVLSMIF